MARTNYRGIAFPFQKSATSLPAAVTDDDLIKQSLVQIVLTGRGERIMRPDFGSNAYAFVFENNDMVLQETIRTEVMSAIAKYETRAIVRGVDVTRSETEVVVTINYVVVATRQEQTVAITMPIS
jgi:phage baseplate assembly protein W